MILFLIRYKVIKLEYCILYFIYVSFLVIIKKCLSFGSINKLSLKLNKYILYKNGVVIVICGNRRKYLMGNMVLRKFLEFIFIID